MSILYYNQKVKPELYIETFKKKQKNYPSCYYNEFC